jgi:hypothetical protein
MLSENEPNSARNENGPILILGVIFIAVILMTICALSVLLLNQQKEPRPTPQQDIPVIFIPTAMPIHFIINLPVTLSGQLSVSEQIWKVTKIKSLGYELGGQRYDLATFTRIDGQETEQGYCINRGWDIPDIGTEYLLTAGGIFVPLYEPDTHPIQRFSKIQ